MWSTHGRAGMKTKAGLGHPIQRSFIVEKSVVSTETKSPLVHTALPQATHAQLRPMVLFIFSSSTLPYEMLLFLFLF